MLKRLYPSNFIDDAVYYADDNYVYGKSAETIAGRWSLSGLEAGDIVVEDTGFNFGAGTAITDAWMTSSGRKFFLVETKATDQYALYRSDFTADSEWAAGTFTKVLDFGDYNGSPITNVYALHDGFVETEVNGVKKIYIYEYNVHTASQRILGGANDPVRILESTDDGATFTSVFTFNTTGHQVKHGHCVAQNPRTKQIIFGGGDSGDPGTANAGQSLICWDGVSPFPPNNTPPENFDNFNGFNSVANLAETRTLSILFDDLGDFYTATDATSAGASGGIWQWASDLSYSTQLDNQVLAFSNKTMWYGTQKNGVHYWTDDVGNTTEASDGAYKIYASSTPSDPGSYKIIGELTVEENVANIASASSSSNVVTLVITASSLYVGSEISVSGFTSDTDANGIFTVDSATKINSTTYHIVYTATNVSDGALTGSDLQVKLGVVKNSSVLAIFFAGEKLVISAPSVPGKSYNNTVIVDVTEEDWKDQVDILAPAFYIDPLNGNDSANGWFPASPWLTLGKALRSGGVTHGSSVNILNKSPLTDTNFINLNFNGYSSPGAGSGPKGSPVQIRGKDRDVSSFTINGNGNTFFFNEEKHTLQVFDMEIQNNTAGNSDIFNMSAADCKTLISDSKVGKTANSNRIFRAQGTGNDCSVIAKRTLLKASDSRPAIQCAGSVTGFSYHAESCVFDGFERAIYKTADSDVTFKNCSILNYKEATSGIDQENLSTVATKMSNLAIYQPGTGASIDVASGAQPTLDAQTNFNVVSTATLPAGYQGSNGSVQNPQLDPTTYTPVLGSPCIAGGQNVDVKYDYNGNLFQVSRPSVGAVEANPLVPYVPGGGAPRAVMYISSRTGPGTSNPFILQSSQEVDLFAVSGLGDGEFVTAEINSVAQGWRTLGTVINQFESTGTLINTTNIAKEYRLTKSATRLATRIESN